MTVQTTSSKAGPFTGNGVVTSFQTSFRVDQASDLQVIYTDPLGNDHLLGQADYAASGFGAPGGVSVTYPASGAPIGPTEKITLLRAVTYDQQTSITNQGGFYPAVLERALDRIVFQTQQLAEKLGRAITLSASSALSGLVLPDPVSGKFLRGRADGTGYENADLTGGGSIGIPVAIAQGGTNATTAAAARTSLGFGAAAVLNAGLAANNLVQLDGSAKLPAVDGSQLLNLAPMKNLIINGKMDLFQRGSTFAAIANNAYSLDRWVYYNTSAAVATISQQADVPSSNEFQNSLRYAVTTADASIAAGDAASIGQWIEGFNARQLIGQTFTLSFWARSAKTGKHCVSFRNSGSDRSFVSEYTINSANTWEKKSITVSGGLITAGTWNWTNGGGVLVSFILASGSTAQTTANAWQTGNFIATSNQVNCLDTNGNIFAITGVQLELGAAASAFEHRLFGAELTLCQRYYEKSFPLNVAAAQATGSFVGVHQATQCVAAGGGMIGITVPFKTTKRTSASTTILYNPISANAQARNLQVSADCTSTAVGVVSDTNFSVGSVMSAGSGTGQNIGFHWTADAEL